MPSNKSRILLVLFLLLAGVLVPGRALCDLTLSVQPDTVIVDEGMEFRVGFYIGEDITDLVGYHVTFSYDPDSLEIVDIEEGVLPLGSGEETFFHSATVDTTIEINGAILGGVVQTPGFIFSVIFKAIKPGVVPLEIQHSDLRDDSNNAISHTVEHGLVIILPAVPVRESSWGAIKARYR